MFYYFSYFLNVLIVQYSQDLLNNVHKERATRHDTTLGLGELATTYFIIHIIWLLNLVHAVRPD